MRSYLHLPPEIVPATLKRQMRAELARPRATVTRTETSKPAEDRQGYRRTTGGPGADKKADVGAGTADVEFVSPCNVVIILLYLFIIYFQRGGFGRGRSAPQ